MENSPTRCIGANPDLCAAAAIEAQRLSEKYNKDFLDCDDLVKILGVGISNVRELMRSKQFSTICIGKRRVVGVLAFAIWSIEKIVEIC